MLVSNARRHSLGILITACISMTCYADFAAPAASDTAVPPNQTVTSADAFPYIAYVGERGISVRSGPGTEYYTTAFLDWGSKVEVYRIDKEKWAAIRPTSRAFSWVPASNVEISEQPDLGIVTQPGTTTRVGTPHGNRHEVEYIQLAEGEVVEILGKKKLPERDGAPSQVWYKITPPAGEFRWVLADSLTRQPPSQEGLDEDSAQSALPQIVQTSHTASANEDHEDAERVSADERLVLAADTSAEGDQWTVVDREDDSWDQVETAEDLQVRIRQEQLQQAQLQQAQLQQAQLQQAQTQQAQTQQTPIQQTQFTEETTQDAAGASAPLSELPTPPPSSGGFREVGANPQAGTTTPETSPPPRPNAL
ncbi:MAG: SH3 domain-containing protein, partial [Planctomycetales bacterium]|nr:SH3 domain-containing protein [Planctomycetales bacterium]